jgi:hypothetical protein
MSLGDIITCAWCGQPTVVYKGNQKCCPGQCRRYYSLERRRRHRERLTRKIPEDASCRLGAYLERGQQAGRTLAEEIRAWAEGIDPAHASDRARKARSPWFATEHVASRVRDAKNLLLAAATYLEENAFFAFCPACGGLGASDGKVCQGCRLGCGWVPRWRYDELMADPEVRANAKEFSKPEDIFYVRCPLCRGALLVETNPCPCTRSNSPGFTPAVTPTFGTRQITRQSYDALVATQKQQERVIHRLTAGCSRIADEGKNRTRAMLIQIARNALNRAKKIQGGSNTEEESNGEED